MATETKVICPVVIEAVMSVPEGRVTNPQRNLNDSLFSGGVNVMISTPGHNVQRTEMTKKLHIPIRAMSLRVPLVMREMDELSYEEIASALKLGLSAVKMRIKRGHISLGGAGRCPPV